MARIRTIKPELPQSESLGRVSREARLCFILLFTIADDHGKLRGHSRMLASLLYPYDEDAPSKIASWLTELEKETCIKQYAIDGTHYIKIMNWHAHQRVDKPTISKIPDPTEKLREDSRGLPEGYRGVLVGSKEGKGKDQGREGTDDERVRAGPPVRETPPPTPERVGNIPPVEQITGQKATYHATEFHPRFNEVREYIIHRLPNLGRQNSTEVNRWLLEGADPEKDIYPTVDNLIEFKRGDIGSFKFFTRAIESSVRVRKETEEQTARMRAKYEPG